MQSGLRSLIMNPGRRSISGKLVPGYRSHDRHVSAIHALLSCSQLGRDRLGPEEPLLLLL
jgi:hypothetical protein